MMRDTVGCITLLWSGRASRAAHRNVRHSRQYQMTELVFGGVVSSGIGHHAELYVPGRAELSTAPADWPERLHPGSLNVSIAVPRRVRNPALHKSGL
jgi:hypothetical protein